MAGSCTAAFPRVYSISGIELAVGTTMPDGTAWDVGGGAPDLFVEMLVNGVVTATTPTKDDAFSASFAGPFDMLIIAGSTLQLNGYDEDLSQNDPAYACVASPITAQNLRSRALHCGSGSNSMRFSIEPK